MKPVLAALVMASPEIKVFGPIGLCTTAPVARWRHCQICSDAVGESDTRVFRATVLPVAVGHGSPFGGEVQYPGLEVTATGFSTPAERRLRSAVS